MCKRFIDVGLWKQPWYLDLTSDQKVIWHYLTLHCDTGGIWKVELYQLKRDTGIKDLNFDEALAAINRDYDNDKVVKVNRVVYLPERKKIWITGFISFQFEKGKNGVNAAIPAVKGAVNRLRDEGLLGYAISNGYVRVYNYKDPDYALTNNSNKEDGSCCQGLATDKDKGKDLASSSCFLKEEGGAGEGTNALPGENTGEPIADPQDAKTDASGRGHDDDEDAAANVLVPVVNVPVSPAIGDSKTFPPSLDKRSRYLTEHLFEEWWGTIPYPGELRISEELYIEFGEEAFVFALKQSSEYKVKKISYIRAILKRQKEKAEKEKEQEEVRRRQQELNHRVEEQRKQGIRLNLIEQVYGKENKEISIST